MQRQGVATSPCHAFLFRTDKGSGPARSGHSVRIRIEWLSFRIEPKSKRGNRSGLAGSVQIQNTVGVQRRGIYHRVPVSESALQFPADATAPDACWKHSDFGHLVLLPGTARGTAGGRACLALMLVLAAAADPVRGRTCDKRVVWSVIARGKVGGHSIGGISRSRQLTCPP